MGPEARRIPPRCDYYGLLGVPEHASAHEIRRAYRRLARQHHPDISDQSGASDRFHAVSEAYQVLHDPDQRARYDDHHVLNGPGGAGAVDGDHTFDRPPDPGRRGDGFIAGGRSAHSPGRWQPLVLGTDVEASLELSPREAALAATIGLTLTDALGTSIVLPAGTRPGQRVRVRGAARRLPGAPPGDLRLTVLITLSPTIRT